MILELAAIFAMSGGPRVVADPTLGERPVSVTGTDAAAYFSWLSDWADRVAEEWRKDGCQTRAVSDFSATVWPITAVPAYMDEKAAGDQMIVERVMVDGCGIASMQNIGVFTGKNGQRWSVSLLQGEGRASPREATIRVSEAFAAAVPHFDKTACDREEAIRTMRIDPVTLPWGIRTDREWSELWPVSICGQVMPVRMDFARGAEGTLTSQATWLEPSALP